MGDRRVEIADAIRQRIFSGLHLGKITPGARLQSTREIAQEFAVATRTAMAAYRLLEAEGLVELRERSGIYVAPGEGGGAMLTQLAGWVVEVLIEARSREIPPIAFPERVRRCLETLRIRAVCIAGSADQTEQICDELKTDYGIESQGIDPEDLMTGGAEVQLALRQADLLIGTAACSTQLHSAARALNKTAITVALRKELMGDISRSLAAGPVYLIGSDPRFREVARAVFDPLPGGINLRPLIVGEDDVENLPGDVPVYIMGRAHRLLPDTDLRRRLTPIRRVFSREMASQLLSFVVRSNMAALASRRVM